MSKVGSGDLFSNKQSACVKSFDARSLFFAGKRIGYNFNPCAAQNVK
jgi:hypothetical protein